MLIVDLISCDCKELNMLQASSLNEAERLRQNSLQQSQRLEAAQQRITDLETQHTKKEQVIREQKKLLENVKSQAMYELTSTFIVLLKVQIHFYDIVLILKVSAH